MGRSATEKNSFTQDITSTKGKVTELQQFVAIGFLIHRDSLSNFLTSRNLPLIRSQYSLIYEQNSQNYYYPQMAQNSRKCLR
jgi:hypothetical protein